MGKLPDRPSRLIEVALRDLRAAERDPHYRVAMGHWHTPPELSATGEHCLVCLAGSVMAFSLVADPLEEVVPNDYGRRTRAKLEALDCFRSGQIRGGLRTMGIEPPDGLWNTEVPTYEWRDPGPFHHAMHNMADALRARGL